MEGEQHHYELRSRSRSRSQTPMVLNRSLEPEQVEHHYDLRSKSRERSHTPGEVTSSRRSGSRSLPGSACKSRDRSMQAIIESKEETCSETGLETQSRKSDSFATTIIKKPERRSERQKAKKQILANGQEELRNSTSETKVEQKRKSVTPQRLLTSDYSSEEGEREDPPSRPGSAYKIYKQSGEWWNVFPKTDYTYSQTSQCRYEIAPGVLAMPNMSRRSIHSDGSSTISSIPSISQQNISQTLHTTAESGIGDSIDGGDRKDRNSQHRTHTDASTDLRSRTRNSESVQRSTMYKKTHIEQYTSHREIINTDPKSAAEFKERYFSWAGNTSSRYGDSKFGRTTQVDSDTELDEAVRTSTTDRKWRITRWFQSLATIIVYSFSRTLELFRLKTSTRRGYRSTYDYRRQESKWSKLWRYVDYYSQYIYLLLIKVIFFDTWLLSRVFSLRKHVTMSGPKILWITLLPLLLLAGYTCLPFILPFMSTVKQTLTESKNTMSSNVQAKVYTADYKDSSFMESNNLLQFIESLNERITQLETGNTNQGEHLLNISQSLEGQKHISVSLWKQYDDKIVALEKRLDEENSKDDVHSDMNTIRQEFHILRELYTQLKTCCNAETNHLTPENIQAHIEKTLANYLGVSAADWPKVIKSMKSIGEDGDSAAVGESSTVNDEQVRGIVSAMLKIYDADKTGRVDYALESAGGQIISTRCTQRYDKKSRAFTLLGFTLYHESNNPRTVIQGNPIQPGVCWAFQDFPGYLLIKLRAFIYVTGFTVEHPHRSILPNGDMRSAPRKFDVWGLVDEKDPEPVMLGDYEFVISDENLQYYPVQNMDVVTPFEYVELRVHSNHGQLEYTCLYRFRVHGRSVTVKP